MTTALHPQETFEFAPDTMSAIGQADGGSGDLRPSITVRAMSCWYWRRLDRCVVDRDGLDPVAYADRIAATLAEAVVGWRNVRAVDDHRSIEYEGPESILRAFAPADLMRAAIAMPGAATLSGIEKKVSRSPSPSGAGGSAPDAAATRTESGSA